VPPAPFRIQVPSILGAHNAEFTRRCDRTLRLHKASSSSSEQAQQPKLPSWLSDLCVIAPYAY
jgi:hypothetical protein